jgi:hypothetical protein
MLHVSRNMPESDPDAAEALAGGLQPGGHGAEVVLHTV